MEFMFNGYNYYKKTKCFYRTNNVTGKTEKISESVFNMNYNSMMELYKKYVCVG